MAIVFKSTLQNQQPNSFLNLTKVSNTNRVNQPINFSENPSSLKQTTNKTNSAKISENSLYDNSFFGSDVLDLHTSGTSNQQNNAAAAYTAAAPNMYNFDNTSFYAEVNQKLSGIAQTYTAGSSSSNQNTSSTSSTSSGDFYAEVNQKLSDINAIFGISNEKGTDSSSDSTSQSSTNPFTNFSSFSLDDIASNSLVTVGNLTSSNVDLSIMSYTDNTDFYKSVNDNLSKIASSTTKSSNSSSGGSSMASAMSQFKSYGDYSTFPSQPKSSNLKKCKHQKGVYKDKTTGKYWKKDSSGWYVEVTNTYSKKGHK
jgi:hypothetical protein